MTRTIFQDWSANPGNPKGRFVMVFFRVCQFIRSWPCGLWLLGAPVLAAYVLLVHWLMGIELDYRTEVGPGLGLFHGVGLVVHAQAKIGAGCLLRHGVTIGERRTGEGAPILGNRVETGANAVILGAIEIGDDAIIGAGAVVLENISPASIAVGNPAREIRRSFAATRG